MVQFKEIIKARHLRKEETKTEKMFWKEIRGNQLGVKFRRQHPIDIFIIDFYIPKIKLAIEIDGSGHNTKEGKDYDKMRTEYLESKDIKVLRFWNSEIEKDLENVLEKIKKEINRKSKPPLQ